MVKSGTEPERKLCNKSNSFDTSGLEDFDMRCELDPNHNGPHVMYERDDAKVMVRITWQEYGSNA